jgi:hypothetical protein
VYADIAGASYRVIGTCTLEFRLADDPDRAVTGDFEMSDDDYTRPILIGRSTVNSHELLRRPRPVNREAFPTGKGPNSSTLNHQVHLYPSTLIAAQVAEIIATLTSYYYRGSGMI